MADNGLPLPNVTTVNTVADWETVFGSAQLDGIVAGRGNELNPTLDSPGRNVVIDTGQAVLRGFGKPISASTPTSVPAASGQNRIDRLVLRLNRTSVTASTFIQPVVITGTPGTNPTAPSITRSQTGNWDLPICRWTSLSSGALTGLMDERPIPIVGYSGVSGARPQVPSGGVVLLYERDTGMIALNDGSSWSYVALTPDTTHKITNFIPQGWHSGSLQYARVAPGLVAVACELQIGGAAEVADGTVICSISSSYAPPVYHHVPLRCDALKVSPQGGSNSYESASLSFRADGTVAVYGVSTAATVLEGTGTYPTAF